MNGVNDVEFTLGFEFDGYEEYLDLNDNTNPEIKELATLYVYDDPEIQKFEESHGNTVLVRLNLTCINSPSGA